MITEIEYKSGRTLKIIDGAYVIGASGSCVNEIKCPKKILNGYVVFGCDDGIKCLENCTANLDKIADMLREDDDKLTFLLKDKKFEDDEAVQFYKTNYPNIYSMMIKCKIVATYIGWRGESQFVATIDCNLNNSDSFGVYDVG